VRRKITSPTKMMIQNAMNKVFGSASLLLLSNKNASNTMKKPTSKALKMLP
jgi:hypothetical protein